MSVSYPSGWHLQPATKPWRGELVQQGSPFADVIYQTAEDSPFIALASMPLGKESADKWASAYMAQVTADDSSCASTRPVSVGGATGVMSEGCSVALVSDGNRGYLVWIYRVDDTNWIDAVLATVKLSPADAVDTTPKP
jgi:hypothetical protein